MARIRVREVLNEPVPMFRTLLRVAKGKKTIAPELVDDALRRWDLP